MSFVIYHIDTTRLVGNRDGYATERAAKAAITREAKKLNIPKPEWAVAEKGHFHRVIELRKTVINLMSGNPIQIGVNTPLHMDPSSETYWSM